MFKRTMTFGLCALGMTFWCVQATAGPPIVINPGGPVTIQAAVDAAVPGDTIVLTPGTYTGAGNTNVDLRGKTLLICSQSNDPTNTIIDGQDVFGGFTINKGEGPGTEIRGISMLRCFNPLPGMCVQAEGSYVTLTNCIFDQDGGTNHGVYKAAVQFDNTVSTTVVNCKFIGYDVGVDAELTGVPGYTPALTIDNTTFTGTDWGVLTWHKTTVTNSQFTNNNNGIGDWGETVIEDSVFKANAQTGISCIGTVAVPRTFTRVTVDGNAVGIRDPNVAPYPLVQDSWILRNGEGYTLNGGIVTNSVFVGNGIGVHSSGMDPATTAYLTNCTITANTVNGVKAVSPTKSMLVVTNCIIHGNAVKDFLAGTMAAATYSDIGTGKKVGTGNIGNNPKFVVPPSPGPDAVWNTPDDVLGDLHLLPGSLCVNAGTAAAPFLPPFDIVGNPRVVGNPDQGVYEQQYVHLTYIKLNPITNAHRGDPKKIYTHLWNVDDGQVTGVPLNVLIDGTLVMTVNSDNTWPFLYTPPMSMSIGAHTLTIQWLGDGVFAPSEKTVPFIIVK